MNRAATERGRRSGCGLLLLACLVTCGLLLANRLLVTSLYLALVPPRLDYPRLRTVIQFLLMVLLLLPEWWLIDRVVERARRLTKPEPPQR